jgi:hypothetical protein
MVLFASLLVGVLRFNYKGEISRHSFPRKFPLKKSLRTLLVGSHQQKTYTLMFSLTKPEKQTRLPTWLPFAEKGSDKNAKNRREDMLNKELLRRWKRRPFYHKNSKKYYFKQKPRPKIKIPKPKTNKFLPR